MTQLTEQRCLVPVNSFCEWPKKKPTWFALSEDRPLFAFAGIWTTWHGVRGTKANPIEGKHRLFGFLTTTANGIVGPVHPKAIPVLLTTLDVETGRVAWRAHLDHLDAAAD